MVTSDYPYSPPSLAFTIFFHSYHSHIATYPYYTSYSSKYTIPSFNTISSLFTSFITNLPKRRDNDAYINPLFGEAQINHETQHDHNENLQKAVALYQQAIGEGAHIESMFNLAVLLERSGKRLAQDVQRSLRLYEISIDEGSHGAGMINLAMLLEYIGNEIEQKMKCAIGLYGQAINEASDAALMDNIALILQKGRNGVVPDA